MKYFIVAGDFSGQSKGKELMKAIQIEDTNAEFFVFGSSEMIIANASLLFDFKALKIMGFWDVLKNIFAFSRLLKYCKNSILLIKPDVVILIDYAGFNLKIARFSNENSFKTIHFIPPKVWAWNESRLEKLNKYIDEIIVIFKFEFDYFKSKSLKTSYFGNPDVENLIKFTQPKERIKKQILLMPGSRQHEINAALPIFEKIIDQRKDLNFKIAGIENLQYTLSKKYNNSEIIYNQNQQLILDSEFGFVVSGTANFEASILGLPHVVCYKTNTFNYVIAKLLVKVKYIALSNLILDKKVVPELIQNEFNLQNCIHYLNQFYDSTNFRINQIKDFESIKELEIGTVVFKKIAKRVVLMAKKA